MRFIGVSLPISSNISETVCPVFKDFAPAISLKREVFVAPGRTLFTVIPYCPNSPARVLLQFATAPRIVFDTPKLGKGCFTEVEMMLIILP